MGAITAALEALEREGAEPRPNSTGLDGGAPGTWKSPAGRAPFAASGGTRRRVLRPGLRSASEISLEHASGRAPRPAPGDTPCPTPDTTVIMVRPCASPLPNCAVRKVPGSVPSSTPAPRRPEARPGGRRRRDIMSVGSSGLMVASSANLKSCRSRRGRAPGSCSPARRFISRVPSCAPSPKMQRRGEQSCRAANRRVATGCRTSCPPTAVNSWPGNSVTGRTAQDRGCRRGAPTPQGLEEARRAAADRSRSGPSSRSARRPPMDASDGCQHASQSFTPPLATTVRRFPTSDRQVRVKGGRRRESAMCSGVFLTLKRPGGQAQSSSAGTRQ